MRRKCEKCKAYFWTRDEKQKLCNDAPCIGYNFIGNPVGRKMKLHEMREAFLSFFEKNGHKRLNRYPVVARWRNDIYLTIASIADFQPHVTSGEVPPPANPLVISQPSIRLNDLEEVGKSGRHLTLFEMMGHHAFNNDEYIYWTEETTEYCNKFLEEIGIDDVTYKEEEWAGGGNAGTCFEVLCSGLEIATLVFMNLKADKNGKYVIKGERYAEMPLKIVDTGYGLERLVWLTNGSKTVYDAIFPYVIDMFDKDEDKMQYIYAIADHTRCILFMLSDGIVPSNSGAGYLARLITRRALRFMEKIGYEESIFSIVKQHMKYISRDFPEIKKEEKRIKEILEIETEKFHNAMKKGKAMVKRYFEKKGKISMDKLIEFYDSHGIHPEIIKEIVNIDIPLDFESKVAERHLRAEEKRIEEKEYDIESYPLYYDDEYKVGFDAEIIYKENNKVILDKTIFYPEGGGQKHDTGYLIQNGKKARVEKVEKIGKAIVHFLDKELEIGKVYGKIDWHRRYAMMLHHTATHIINYSARTVLGSHVWQAGSDLNEEEARLDITHYKRISEEEAREIEKIANERVRKALPVKKDFMRRDLAEKKFGFRLYQGGAPKGSIIRVVNIENTEAEACGGTHVNNTSEIGLIKIIGIERVQDGVERLRFCAGERAIEYIQKQEKLLKESANLLSVEPEKIIDAIKKLYNEWKKVKKEVKKLQEKLGKEKAEEFKGIKIIIQDDLIPSTIKELTKEKAVVISASRKGKNALLTIACSSDLPLDCSKIAKEVGKILGGGGGKRTIAQAGGTMEKLPEAKEKAIRLIKEEINEM